MPCPKCGHEDCKAHDYTVEMERAETKEMNIACTLADAYWKAYNLETVPSKRRLYGERYAEWAQYRDDLRGGNA